ncbi:hypothetical protein [Sulfuricurvum sp.]|uniref:hypothetical protein n=1 Tax=Sulfuricurvum sp. TaxID=2025608 RepID=UPI003BAE3CC3
MKSITFQNINLNVVESTEHTFLMSSRDVAAGYGIEEKTIRNHKRIQSDELIEGKHFIMTRTANNAAKTMWTLEGVHMLGFFIKSERAKEFRKWTAKLLTEIRKGNATVIGQEQYDLLQDTVFRQNAQIVQLNKELDNRSKRLPVKPTDENLKRVLIRVHDGYHRILTTCSPLDMIDELRRMTNLFQCIGSIKKNGNNLNTDTVAGHLYWI